MIVPHPLVLRGQRIQLRPVQGSDLPHLRSLWANRHVMSHVGYPKGIRLSKDKVAAWFSGLYRDCDLSVNPYRMVVTDYDGHFLGEACIGQLSREGISTLEVKLLPEHWGKGYGREALALLVHYCFVHLRIPALQAAPAITNLRAIRMVEALGFEPSGETYDWVPPRALRKTAVPYQYTLFTLPRARYAERSATSETQPFSAIQATAPTAP